MRRARPGVPLTPPRCARIVIATEHALLRDGLRSLLETQWRLCTVLDAGTGPQAALRAAWLRADLLLLDFSLSTLLAAHELRSLAEDIPIVILSDASGSHDRRAAHALGVRGVIEKNAGATALLAVVRSVLPRDHRLNIDNGDEPAAHRASPALAPGAFELTQRERQVLELVAEAYANKEIAERLDIAEDTVKRHLTSVFDKIGVSNRVELALFATQHDDLLADLDLPATPILRARAANSRQ